MTKQDIVRVLKQYHLMPQAILVDWYIVELFKDTPEVDEDGVPYDDEYLYRGFVDWMLKGYKHITSYNQQVDKIKTVIEVNYPHAVKAYRERNTTNKTVYTNDRP